MLEKTTISEILKTIVEGKVKITNNSLRGECSRCGECCTNFLPISQNELYTIQDYVITNNIRPQKQILVMQNRLTCPYYNGKKCLIYNVRPLICREFYCYKEIANVNTAKKFAKDKYMTIDMWRVAEAIDEQRRKK